MSQTSAVVDQTIRETALDPTRSFIVQAPAGSGKTGLLVQRVLALLSKAREPEEIIAITFTRKAASEMRQRILGALQGVESESVPEEDYERRTQELARLVLVRDRERRWNLLEQPGRLRIQTIDSLCASLARQMPIPSGFGAVPAVAEDSWGLYEEAAEATLAELEEDCGWADAVACLLEHLDNRLEKVQQLIADMLSRRDQWLRHIADPRQPQIERGSLEAAFGRVVTDLLAHLAAQVPRGCEPELTELARFAGNQVDAKDSPISACAGLRQLPGPCISDRSQWEGIAALLLTKGQSWRKGLTAREGFPPKNRGKDEREKARLVEMKSRMLALLRQLEGEESLREALAKLTEAPSDSYTDEEWQVLQALVKVLRVAAAHLELVFARHGRVDFTALAQAALRALGEPDAPTDLALALDHRIGHILVDEFQDTSFEQYRLLERLTAGWQRNDGHTLFVVGDPMQSIYRFREADVGLFLAAQQSGIGDVRLEPLRLTVNFRSQQGIVDWLNQSFPAVFPKSEDLDNGAVTYAPSDGLRPTLAGPGVVVHPVLGRDDLSEAQQVEALVRAAQEKDRGGTIAILVRSRSHLEAIVGQLRAAQLRFQAVEIEPLSERPVVQDLLALTRALSHLGDRLAWLALLRAPFCGLTLKDLYMLAGHDLTDTVFDLLHRRALVETLSADGQDRIRRVLPVLDAVFCQRGRVSLKRQVEGAWIALGGPACLSDVTGSEDAQSYFDCLEQLCDSIHNPDPGEISESVDQLYSSPDLKADGLVQLMTIHKAKGLEFDTVIVPGLGRTPRSGQDRLLHWLERGYPVEKSDLLLAPISRWGEDKNRMASYLRQLESTKSHFEAGRLLYVACTRAKNRLHLLGHVDVRSSDEMTRLQMPPARSLLSQLWPIVESEFQVGLAASGTAPEASEMATPKSASASLPRLRLTADWTTPSPLADVMRVSSLVTRSADGPIVFDWAGEMARHVGTVVHRLFQYIAQRGVENTENRELDRLVRASRQMLLRLGLQQRHIDSAVQRVSVALKTATESRRGRWILSNAHRLAACELAISAKGDTQVGHWIIDRTFVDEMGNRWIVDYKTGTHGGGQREAFLDQEQERYRDQLEAYAAVLSRIDDRPIRLGLYFPALDAWREWLFEPELTR